MAKAAVEAPPTPATEQSSADNNNNNNNETDIIDVIQGMKYASLAMTNDQKGSSLKVDSWHMDALKIVIGSADDAAQKPLTYLLKEHLDLTCDTIIDIDATKGGELDTQGYIAHNDKVIVLAYHCTTSIFDWLTNLNCASSEWEIPEDVEQGFSGYASGLVCCSGAGQVTKPRVHAGFYNKFLSSIPAITQYIDPLLLGKDQPPRKLYVVGHSLGAGIATLAASYLLLQYDWNNLSHSMVSVTTGSPRPFLKEMQDTIMEELQTKGAKVKMIRVVRNKDVVATVPSRNKLGFHHPAAAKLVFITDTGDIQWNSTTPQRDTEDARIQSSAAKYGPAASQNKIPKAFRDHMPDFYLLPMKQYRPNLFPIDQVEQTDQVQPIDKEAGKERKGMKKLIRMFSRNKKEAAAAVVVQQ